MKQFSSRRTNDQTLDRNFDELAQFSVDVIASQIVDNIIVKDIELGASPTNVAHLLGRAPRGWFIVRKNSNAEVWEPQASPQPSTLITLQSSVTTTVDVLFF